jgi:hypothetical protein
MVPLLGQRVSGIKELDISSARPSPAATQKRRVALPCPSHRSHGAHITGWLRDGPWMLAEIFSHVFDR